MDVIQKHDCGTNTIKPTRKRSSSKRKEKANIEKMKEEIEDNNSSSILLAKKKVVGKRLRKKLIEAAEQNQTLEKAISDKNSEITELKRSVQSLNDVLNSVPIDELRCNSSIAGSKILELSKKNRLLRAELETTKNHVNKKDMEIQKLHRKLQTTESKCAQEADTRKANSAPNDELQNKINSLMQKLFESRNKNAELHTQLKLAQKCLQQEVGENFNLNILASHSLQSNWRGRAQQILHLQQKMHEMKERLESYEHHTNGRFAGCSENVTPVTTSLASKESATSLPNTRSSHPPLLSAGVPFDRFTPHTRKSEILHRAKVDELEKEIDGMKQQLEVQRGKILALKVRNKTLNEDVLRHKMKSSTLEEQTDFNGLNLTSMNDKLHMQKYQFENRLEELSREMSKAVRERDDGQYRVDEMRIKLENTEDLMANKEKHIRDLEEAICKLETDLKAVCGGFLFSCRELRKEEFIAILDALETEKNLLLEHNKKLDERVQQERSKKENLAELLAKHKTRCSRLEAKIRDLEKDLEMQTERHKRSQRIAEYANSVSATSKNSSVGSFTFENSSLSSAVIVPEETQMTQPEIADMQNSLELASEKITLLEEKISYMTAEKENDVKTFQEIIRNSKQIILDTIMNQKMNVSTTGENSESTSLG